MLDNLPKNVKVVEVGPRDGLQNEAKILTTKEKVQFINALAEAGEKNIEVTSFVSPQWIPQLADAEELCKQLKLPSSINCSALVPNAKGYERTKSLPLSTISLFMSATETHNKKNINKTIGESLKIFEQLIAQIKQDGKQVRAYLSVVFVCPYEGIVNQSKVINLCKNLLELGVDELSLGDTIGASTPKMVFSLIDKLQKIESLQKFALHFHDTQGMALVNTMAGLQSGITIFDSSIGGMGGCPYAPGAAGNLATEDLVHLLNSLDIQTGIDLDKLIICGQLAEQLLGKELPGRYLKARLANKTDKMS